MPEVIVIDEIGTELEAHAARTIAERGVQLIGTAHGNNLDNLMLNPTLSDLIGGIQSVTLGDEEGRPRRRSAAGRPRGAGAALARRGRRAPHAGPAPSVADPGARPGRSLQRPRRWGHGLAGRAGLASGRPRARIPRGRARPGRS